MVAHNQRSWSAPPQGQDETIRIGYDTSYFSPADGTTMHNRHFDRSPDISRDEAEKSISKKLYKTNP